MSLRNLSLAGIESVVASAVSTNLIRNPFFVPDATFAAGWVSSAGTNTLVPSAVGSGRQLAMGPSAIVTSKDFFSLNSGHDALLLPKFTLTVLLKSDLTSISDVLTVNILGSDGVTVIATHSFAPTTTSSLYSEAIAIPNGTQACKLQLLTPATAGQTMRVDLISLIPGEIQPTYFGQHPLTEVDLANLTSELQAYINAHMPTAPDLTPYVKLAGAAQSISSPLTLTQPIVLTAPTLATHGARLQDVTDAIIAAAPAPDMTATWFTMLNVSMPNLTNTRNGVVLKDATRQETFDATGVGPNGLATAAFSTYLQQTTDGLKVLKPCSLLITASGAVCMDGGGDVKISILQIWRKRGINYILLGSDHFQDDAAGGNPNTIPTNSLAVTYSFQPDDVIQVGFSNPGYGEVWVDGNDHRCAVSISLVGIPSALPLTINNSNRIDWTSTVDPAVTPQTRVLALVSSNALGSVTWSLDAGTNLPNYPGTTQIVNNNSLSVYFTAQEPLANGRVAVLKAVDSARPALSGGQALKSVIVTMTYIAPGSNPPVIASTAGSTVTLQAANNSTDQICTYTGLSCSGGVAPYTWSLTNALPTGVTIQSISSTGVLTFESALGANLSGLVFTIHVVDSTAGTPLTADYTLTVNVNGYVAPPTCSPDCYADGTCFAAETLVLLADGSIKKIEDVVAGDLLASANIRAYEDKRIIELATGTVLHTNPHPPTRPLWSVCDLPVTDEHPFATFMRGWKSPQELGVEDRLIGLDQHHDLQTFPMQSATTTTFQPDMVYNFEVDLNTYFVSKDGLVWYLVHNMALPLS